MKLKKGDQIIVLLGKDKGKTGTIDKVLRKKNSVVVPGINMVKRHMKKRDNTNQGGIFDMVKPIDVSKVAFYDSKSKKATRIGYLVTKGEKTRINKKTGQAL